MSNKEKVIFDTNTLRNTEPRTFLWWRDELQKFLKSADIILPEIVVDELKAQKRKSLEKHKQTFLDNPFHWLRKVNPEETKDFDNHAHVEQLEKDEDIEYEVIRLTDYSAMEKMRELAIKKLPPFESGDNTDKWFKDAYIYFTILEYLQTTSDKYVFVCTWDWRLKEALSRHESIIIIENYEEFRKKSMLSLTDEYFLEKLWIAFWVEVNKSDVLDYWYNFESTQIVLVNVQWRKFVVEVDNREVVAYWNTENYIPLIEELINSGTYRDTHRLIKELKTDMKWFSDQDIEKLFTALFENDQITWAFGYSVKEFYIDLYKAKWSTLPQELKDKMEKLVGQFDIIL